MLLLPLYCVFIRIGRRRATPREILSTGTDRRDIRRAETAWRREYADRAPPVGETTAALRALGAVRDGDRVASLLRWCDARGAAYSPSAAVAALALAGHATAARARAAASSVDAVAAALTADGVSPHLAALHAAQRTGALDLHGLDPAEATRAVALVLDHRDLLDDVLIITGRGKHSQKGSVVKSEVHALLERRGAVFVEENEGAVRLQRATSVDLWLDARRGGQDVASRGIVTVFLADEAAEAAGDVVTMVARGADVVDGDGRCVGRVVDSTGAQARSDIDVVIRGGAYDLLVLDGAPSDLLAFALERTARCNGISGAALTVVQCVSNEEQVAAAVDAGATTLCVAGDSATWAMAREATPAGGEDDEGEDIEDMSIEQLQELMEEIGGPRVEEMALAEARDVAWRFVEENFGAEHDHDDDHDEEEIDDADIAYVGGGKYTENVSELDDMGLEELVALMDDVGGPGVEGLSLADAQDAAWQFLEENFSDVCEGD